MDELERRLRTLTLPAPTPPPVDLLRRRARRRRTRRRLLGATAVVAVAVAAVAAVLQITARAPRVMFDSDRPEPAEVAAADLDLDLVISPPAGDHIVWLGADGGRLQTVLDPGAGPVGAPGAFPDGRRGAVYPAGDGDDTQLWHLPEPDARPRPLEVSVAAPRLLGVGRLPRGPVVLYTDQAGTTVRAFRLDDGTDEVIAESASTGALVAADATEDGAVLWATTDGVWLRPAATAGDESQSDGEAVQVYEAPGAVVDARLGSSGGAVLVLATEGDTSASADGDSDGDTGASAAVHLLDPPLPQPVRSAALPRSEQAAPAGLAFDGRDRFLVNQVGPDGAPARPLVGRLGDDAWQVVDLEGVARLAAPGSGPAPEASGTEAFVPDTRTDGARTVAPVAFPDGSTAQVAYPADLALAEQGVSPVWNVRIAPDDPAGPPIRAHRTLEFHHGDLDAVLADLNGGRPPEPVATYGDDVRLWDMDDDLLDRDFLALQLGSWTVLVPDRIRDRGQVNELSDADREVYATHLAGLREVAGLPVLELQPPLEPAGRAELVFGPTAQRLAHSRTHASPVEGPLVVVTASGCVAGEQEPGRRDEPAGVSVASWCQADAQVSFAAWGDEAFVRHVRDGLQAREVRLAPSVVDDTWLTDAQRAAWEQANGPATWVPGLFYPPDVDPHTGPVEPDQLVVRWQRSADEPRELDDAERTAVAFEHLEGAPPPGLVTALRDVPMRVRSASVDEGVVTIDFSAAIVAPTSLGSTAGMATSTQIIAQVRHLYPGAHTLCILIEGDGGLDEPGPFLFHEAEGCPIALTADSPYAHTHTPPAGA